MEESETYLRVNKGPRFFSLSIISTALKIGEFFGGGMAARNRASDPSNRKNLPKKFKPFNNVTSLKYLFLVSHDILFSPFYRAKRWKKRTNSKPNIFA